MDELMSIFLDKPFLWAFLIVVAVAISWLMAFLQEGARDKKKGASHAIDGGDQG